MEKKVIISPTTGMDSDSSLNRRSPNTIFEAVNLRLNNSEKFNTGTYSNYKGLKDAIICDGYTILKIDRLHGSFFLFLKKNTEPYTDYIAKVEEQDMPFSDGDSRVNLNLDSYYWIRSTPEVYHKVISGNFGFSSDKEIFSKTYYESEIVQKLYWITDGEPLRSIVLSNDLDRYSETDIEAIIPADLPIPVISLVTGGKLKSGKICYSYTLSNKTGGETLPSPMTNLINLASNSTEQNDINYKGSEIDEPSNKSVKIVIGNIASPFNRIKLYSIHYISDTAMPIISLLYDDYVSTSFTYIDNGNKLIEIAPEEFISLTQEYITGGIFEFKDNRLYRANYKENYFDPYWDARAYRFNSSRECRVYNIDNSYVSLTAAGNTVPLYARVPYTHDCINPSNDITNSASRPANAYMYQQNGTDIGASGANVTIKTINLSSGLYIDDYNNKMYGSKRRSSYICSGGYTGYSSYANEKLAMDKKTFIPEEVYRLAIQFKDSKGRLSKPKWICDYKMYAPGVAVGGTLPFRMVGSLEGKIFGIDVTVSNIPLDSITGEPLKWRLLYSPITEDDKSAFWGTMQVMYSGDEFYEKSLFNMDYFVKDYMTPVNDLDFGVDRPNFKLSNRYIEFISPDYIMGNSKEYSYITTFANSLVNTNDPYNNDITSHETYNNGRIWKSNYYNFTDNTINKYEVLFQYDLSFNNDPFGYVETQDYCRIRSVGRTVTKMYRNEKNYILGYSFRGRRQVLKLPSVFTETSNDRLLHYACAYVDNHATRYGGETYIARKSSKYIPLDANFYSSSVNPYFYYGDAYNSVFEHLSQISSNENIPTESTSIPDYQPLPGTCLITFFPVVSHYNFKLKNGYGFGDINLDYWSGSYMMHEKQGVYSDPHTELNIESEILTQKKDFYNYNKTYSVVNDLYSYYENQSDYTYSSFKNRIIAMLPKVAGDKVDYALKNSGAYIDVNAQYGEITALLEFNNLLYFFQKEAIGIATTNERSQIPDNLGNNIIIGEAGLLSRIDYISTINGISDNKKICKSNIGIYGIDSDKKLLFFLNNVGLEKISILYNVNSFVRNINWANGIVLNNYQYNEIYFITDDDSYYGNSLALVYNEEMKRFTHISTFDKHIIDYCSISDNNNGISEKVILSNDSRVYLMNSGDYNSSGYNKAHPSKITFLTSAPSENVVLYNVVEFILKQTNESLSDISGFIESIRVYNNDGMDTGEVAFSTCRNLYGKYRFNKLRNDENVIERMITDHIYVSITTKSNYNISEDKYDNFRVFIRDLVVYFNDISWFR